MSSFPIDPNRRSNFTLPEDGSWPSSLRWGYVLCVISAILMMLTGFIMFSEGFQGGLDAPAEYREAFMMNLRIVAGGNIILALCIGATAAQLSKRNRGARRWLLAFIAIAAGINVLGFVFTVSGLMSIFLVVLLAMAAVLIFRPASNAYMRQDS